MTTKSRVLLCGLLAVNSAWAQLAVPNPTIRPMTAKPQVALPSPVAAGSEEEMPPVPPPVRRAKSDGGGSSVQAALAAATRGLFVSAIVNKRAILRGPAPTGNSVSLPSATQSGATGAPRLVSYTVRDGEPFLLTDMQEVMVRVSERRVMLYYVEGNKKQLVFRGELDSIAPAAPARPAAAELVQRNAEFLKQRSVSGDASVAASAAQK